MQLRSISLTVGGTPIGQAVTWSYPNSDGKIYVIPTYALTLEGSDASHQRVTHTFEVLRFGVHRRTTQAKPTVVGLAHRQTHTIKRWIPTYKVHSFRSREDGAWQVHGNYLIHDGPDDPSAQLYATAGCIEVCGGPDGFVAFNKLVVQLAGSNKSDLARQLQQVGASGCMSITYLAAVAPPIQLL